MTYMSPEARAAVVAEIAEHYAHRQRYGVAHTGHTVNRLLAAVSALIGKPVVLADDIEVSR